jgi:hypothetical protein
MKTIKFAVFLGSLLVLLMVFAAGCGTSVAPVVEATATEQIIPTNPPTLPPVFPTTLPKVIPTTVQDVPTEPTPPPHVLIPGEFTGKEQVIHDQDTEPYASENKAAGGDEFKQGRFERPFDKKMVYLGNLDIVKSTMIRTDPEFIFVTIQVAKPVASAINNAAFYGLELDLNRDGRSLFMIRGLGPLSEDWTTEGVDVWKSSAAEQPLTMASEGGIPVTGALGFDVNLLRAGRGTDSDLAWIRLKPGTEDIVEIAFKNTIVGGEKGKFIWRPFTDGAPFSEREYDLQVSYTLEQAGSPYKGEINYPLKDVFAVDNTCRVASGYTASGYEPGICPLPEKAQGDPEKSPPCFNPNGRPC